jgi:Zn-dependent protease with chaperone function
VSGKPAVIVVTTAALAALDDGQLRAVLAHERAHLAGHHPHVVAVVRGLATVFPNLTLMTEGAKQVSRLLEMCADDAAARRHGRRALLSGLVALSGTAPAAALGAADVAVVARAERLSTPWTYLARARTRAALTSTVTLMAAGPLITVALAASGVLMCGAQ